MRIDRRNFLKAGAATLALPLLPSISRAAEAAEYPQRLIIVMTPNGTIPDAWNPLRRNGGWEFNTIHEPLQPFKDRVTVLEGVDNLISNRDFAPGNAHPRGIASLLTGRPLGEGNFDFGGGGIGYGTGISIDQYIANQLNLSQEYAFPTLELGAYTRNNPYLTNQVISYKGPNQPSFPEDDPHKVFDRVFGGGTNAGAAEVERLREMRHNILDAVHEDWRSYRQGLSTSDKERVEKHLESVAGIQDRLAAAGQVECSGPRVDDAIQASRVTDLPRIVRAQIDIMVKAMACRLTSISTFVVTRATSGVPYTWLPNHTFETNDERRNLKHHVMSHNDDNPRVKQRLIEINRWYSEQFAYLMEQLDAVPEPTAENPAATMLDHTLIMTTSEIGKGKEHWLDQMPILLAGGLHGKFKMGEHLRFGDNRSHQGLLAAIAESFGVPTDRFGDERTWDRTLTEVLT